MKIENISTLKINRLTQEQYEKAKAEDKLNDSELYFTPASPTGGDIDVTEYAYSKTETYSRVEVDAKIPSLDGYAKTSDLNSKQDKLTFDGTYNASTNKAATVNTVATEVAKMLAGADADFDTLKEMSDWLTEHKDSAATMNSAIQKNRQDIANMQEEIVSDKEEFHIVDANDNIVATIDKDGVQSVAFLDKDGVDLKDYSNSVAVTNSGTPGLSYEKLNNISYACVGKGSAGSNVVIPATYNGLPVTKIEDDAFNGTYVTSVDLSKKITEIGYRAFQTCTTLEHVIFGKTLTKINQYAFDGCSKLDEVIIPKGCTFIGQYAFYKCAALRKIYIPSGVTTVETYAISHCPNVTVYCEDASRPSGWSSNWVPISIPVVWGVKSPSVMSSFEALSADTATRLIPSYTQATITDGKVAISNIELGKMYVVSMQPQSGYPFYTCTILVTDRVLSNMSSMASPYRCRLDFDTSAADCTTGKITFLDASNGVVIPVAVYIREI